MSDDDHRVAQRADLLHHVAREQHAVPFVAQASQQAAQRAHGHDVQSIGWLIQQHVRWAVHEGPRECSLHALALREALRDPVREFFHLEKPDQLGRARLPLAALQAVQGAEVQNVLARGEIRIDTGSVRQHPHQPAGRERLADRAGAIDQSVARVRHQHRIEDPERGRLAGAVGAEQSGDAAVARAQRHVADGLDRTEILLQVRGFNHACRVAFVASRSRVLTVLGWFMARGRSGT